MSVTVTNKEIYNKLLDVERHVMVTNGKVKLNRWIASTAMALILILVGVLVTPAASALMMGALFIPV